MCVFQSRIAALKKTKDFIIIQISKQDTLQH